MAKAISNNDKEVIHSQLMGLRRAKGAHKVHGFKQISPTSFEYNEPTDDENENKDGIQANSESGDTLEGSSNTQVSTNTNEDTLESSEANSSSLSNTNEQNDPHDWKKRYSDLKSYTDRTVNDLKSQMVELQKSLKEAQVKPIVFPKSETDLEAFKQDYPDLYDSILTVGRKEALKVSSELKQEMEDIRKLRNQLETEKAFTQLLKRHPDAVDIKNDPLFATWYEKQSKGVQALLNSDDVEDAARGLDIFKLETNYGKGRAKTGSLAAPNSKAKAAEAITTNNKPEIGKQAKVWRESEIERMSFRDYEKHEAEIEQARKRGDFIFDISNKL